MADLNVALILRLVDKATAPARTALRQIERSGSAMRSFGAQQVALSRSQIANAQARTGALAGEAVALAGTGYAMVKALGPAIEFEAAMAKVGAVSRASDDDLATLTDTARMLGRETPWSASQAAEGMQYLAMAGFDVNEVVAAMPGMLALASAGATDLGSTADIASNILTGFGMQAGEMGHVGDVLVNTFTSSNTTVGMLGETMKYVAPAAASLGVDLETAAAMAGKLGDAGIQGSEAGTALRGMLTRLAAPSKEASDALKKLKVSVSDANGDMRAVPDILADIDEAMRGYGGAARAELIKTLFETEAMSAATILLGQAGSGSLQSYAESLKETGSAARVAAQINATTAGAIKTLQSRAEALSIALGTLLLPMIVDLTDALIPMFDKLTAWGEANPELVRGAALLAAGLLGLRVALLAGRIVLQPLIIAFWALNGALGALIWVFGAATSTIAFFGRILLWTSTVVARLAVGAFGLLGRTLLFVGRTLLWVGRVALANPLLLVLTGIALAVWAIYENWDGFVSYFTDKIDRVRAAFEQGLLNGVLALLSELNPFAMMRDGAIALADFILGKLRDAFDLNLFDKGAAMIASLKDGAWSILTSMVDGIRAKLQSIVPDWMIEAWNWVKGDEAAPGGGVPQEPTGARALGGPVRAGGIYRWMEEGQEMFSPTVDGSVISARQLGALKAGGTGRSSSISIGDIVIHAAPGQSAAEVAQVVRREIERLLKPSGALHDGGAYAD
jgi:TP901 family phage tail tape measure protein